MHYLKRYGSDPIAYSTIQSGLRDYYIADSGYASYASCLGSHFILGSIICSDKDLENFATEVIKDLGCPSFVQINKSFARLLHDHFGYKVTKIGVESQLHTQSYELSNDYKKRNLRSYIRKGERQSNIYELTIEGLSKQFDISVGDIECVTKQWLSQKKRKKQIRFLTRETIYEDEPGVRKFYSIDKNNELIGFVFFNPIYSEGETVGYCADHMRVVKGASKGHVAYIIMKAFEKLKQEGISYLSLGLSPFYRLGSDTDFKESLGLRALFQFLYRYGNRLHNFKGLSSYKAQFRGDEHDVYVATKSINPIKDVLAFHKYMGLI
ncbi:MAG: DUF2156 domain-containing protein [Verrucomicrobiota bacterium]